jgi:hypothetical protein
MKYLRAILSTITMVLMPLIMIPLLQWYELKFLAPKTDIFAVYVLLFFISMGHLFINIVFWVSAIKNKDIKDL